MAPAEPTKYDERNDWAKEPLSPTASLLSITLIKAVYAKQMLHNRNYDFHQEVTID